MLAFSIDYYGLIFRATLSVELFCAYDISIPEACYADLCKVGFFERKQVKLTIIWNEKISRNKQILTLKKLYPELNKVSTVESYKITKKRRNGNLQRWDGDLLLTFRIKQKKRG